MNTNLSTLWVVDPSKDKFGVGINEIQTSWTLLDLKRANIEDMTTKFRTLHKQKKILRCQQRKERYYSHPFLRIDFSTSIQFCRTSPNLLDWCFARKMNSSLESWRLWNWKLNCNMKNTDPPRAWSQTWSQKGVWVVCLDLFELFKSCSSGRCRYEVSMRYTIWYNIIS